MRLKFLNTFFKTSAIGMTMFMAPIIPIEPLDPLRFSTVECGPYKIGDDINITVTVISDTYIENVSIGLIGCDGSKAEWDGEDTYSVKSQVFDLDENLRQTYNLHLTGKCATATLTHYKLCLIDEDDGQAFSFGVYFDLYIRPLEYTKTTINPLNYQNARFELPKDRFTIFNNKVTYTGEYFEFENFYDYFLVDEYYRLKLDQYKCNFSISRMYRWVDAYIELINPQPCFQYLCNDEGVAKLNLICRNHEDSYFSLEFEGPFYVNPQTKEMSVTPRNGFRETHYFYFPINCKEQVQKQEFRISIIGMGYWETNMIWSSYLTTDTNLIGDCSTSKYCVVGGQSS